MALIKLRLLVFALRPFPTNAFSVEAAPPVPAGP